MTPAVLADKTSISFEETVFSFGEISQGETVEFVFSFTNTGEFPLVLAGVKPSCGCTITEDWPDYPIAPGEGGVIPVKFDSKGKRGHQSKNITVVANTLPNTTVLTLEGDIIAPSE